MFSNGNESQGATWGGPVSSVQMGQLTTAPSKAVSVIAEINEQRVTLDDLAQSLAALYDRVSAILGPDPRIGNDVAKTMPEPPEPTNVAVMIRANTRRLRTLRDAVQLLIQRVEL